MDVHDPAAGKDLVEFVALQLIEAGAAADHDGLDVQIIERGRDAMEQHPVVRDDLLRLVEFPGAALRDSHSTGNRGAARFVRRRTTALPGWRAPPARTVARNRSPENKTRLRHSLAGGLRVADDGHVIAVLDVEQRARRALFGRPPGMRLLTKWITCSFIGGFPVVARWPLGLRFGERMQRPVRQALGLVSPVDHHLARHLDGLRDEWHSGRTWMPRCPD